MIINLFLWLKSGSSMAQNYTVSFKVGNKGKDDFRKIYIRVTGKGTDIKVPTSVKIVEDHFNGKEVIKHANKAKLNALLDKERIRVEGLLLDAALKDISVNADYLNDKTTSKDQLKTFIDKYVEGIKNAETKKSRKSIFKKLPDIRFSDIGINFMKDFQSSLSDLDQNTVHTQMVRVKTLLLLAIKADYIVNPKVIKSIQEFKPVPYLEKIPEYLTIKEINEFTKSVKQLKHLQKKNAGFYFLLSCYTGWRLGDLKTFNYADRVKNGMVILRASKNNKIVSIPVYPKLKQVLAYCRENPLSMTEQHFRIYVKQIAGDIGINQVKRNIKIHTGRHSFAMMLIDKGFSIDEVAAFLGDSPEVARVYARITNTHLSDKIRKVLF